MIKWTLRNAIAVTALIVGLGLAAPEAAQVSAEAAANADTFTPKRIVASGAVVIGLIGAVIGALALTWPSGAAGNGLGGPGALVLGPIAAVIGGIVVARPARRYRHRQWSGWWDCGNSRRGRRHDHGRARAMGKKNET